MSFLDVSLIALLFLAAAFAVLCGIKQMLVRADLDEALEQIEEDAAYIAELRDNLAEAHASTWHRQPSRAAGIINRARG